MKRAQLFASLVGIAFPAGLFGFGCALPPINEASGEPQEESGATEVRLTPRDRSMSEPQDRSAGSRERREEPESTVAGKLAGAPQCGAPVAFALLTGQSMDAGVVTVETRDAMLCVGYEASRDWSLSETHIHVASALSGVPRAPSGSPVVGRFADAQQHGSALAAYERCFVLADLGYEAGEEILVAAHAKMSGTANGRILPEESGWGQGEPFPGGDVAEYIRYAIPQCE